MKFSTTRKAVATIRSKTLRADFERMIARIEKTSGTQKKLAGQRTTALIGLTMRLQSTLPLKIRMAIVAAFFADSEHFEVPHQWERKKDYDCKGTDDCSNPHPGVTCFRDTSDPDSCFAVPSRLLTKP